MNFCTLFLFVYLVTRPGVLLINNLEKNVYSRSGGPDLYFILFYSATSMQRFLPMPFLASSLCLFG